MPFYLAAWIVYHEKNPAMVESVLGKENEGQREYQPRCRRRAVMGAGPVKIWGRNKACCVRRAWRARFRYEEEQLHLNFSTWILLRFHNIIIRCS